MSTIYTLDANNIYAGAHDASDPYAPVPPGVSKPPPELTGTQVACWTGSEWEVLASYPAPRPDAQRRQITKLAFRNRFTAIEKVLMELASLDDPAATLQQRQQAAMLRVNLADMAAAVFIDLSRTDTRAGVQQLEAAGLLAAGRALEILDAPVLRSERPL